MPAHFHEIPSVDSIIVDRRMEHLIGEYSRSSVLSIIRQQLHETRNRVKAGFAAPSIEDLIEAITNKAIESWHQWPRPLINATGVVLHTNLGRAPLSNEATIAIRDAAQTYTELELNIEDGKRGSRQKFLSRLVCELTGAKASFVVNNNASALLIGLAATVAGKEVLVSRGEAVEIGGGFRIPDVLRQSGAELVEVGTTNRTYITDYERALNEKTGAILSVHTSNFRVTGFTHSPNLEELVQFGHKHSLPVLHDLGSGCLLDTTRFGLEHEPIPQESIAAGANLAFFSGDKLLGGPQAGIVVGDQELINAISQHPLARALRIDKLSMAGLIATLLHYIKNEAEQVVPIWRMISQTVTQLRDRAQEWSNEIGGQAAVTEGFSTIGGGSLPGETLPTSLLTLQPSSDTGANKLLRELRCSNPPVIGRIENQQVLLDPRTVLPEQDTDLLRVISDCKIDR